MDAPPIKSPQIELLAWSGCATHPAAYRAIEAELAAQGRPDYPIEFHWVESTELAAAEQFVGCPTIRIDGVDIVAPIPGSASSLSCRLYRTRAGRYSPLPDPADLHDAISAAFA
jgi:hypothetical protein